jgi:hypothetical protein
MYNKLNITENVEELCLKLIFQFSLLISNLINECIFIIGKLSTSS